MDLSQAALDFAPWSYSMANKAHTCPFAFHQQYVVKAESKEPPRIENQTGTAVHSILELGVKGTSVEQAYQEVIDKGLLYDVEIAIHKYRVAIEEFLAGLEKFKQQFDVAHVFSEKRLGITKDFRTTDYWNNRGDCVLRGAVDLTLLTRKGQAAIIDHKSGVRRKLSTYDKQFRVYGVLVAAFIGNLRSLRTAIHFVGADKNNRGTRTDWGPEYPVATVRTKFRDDVVRWLNEAAESAQTQTPKETWLCGFCGHQYLCPLKN